MQIKKYKYALLGILLFAVAGTAAVLMSLADTPTNNSIEPENGTVDSSVIVSQNDPSASNNSSVQFKNSTVLQKTQCMPAPHLCGFADQTNTGIRPGVSLTKVPSGATSGSGWNYVSSSKQIVITGNVGSSTTGIEAEDSVTVFITGSNLTVQNLKVTGAHGDSTDGVLIDGSTTGVTIDRCDIQGANPAAGNVSPTRGWNGIHIRSGAKSYSIKHCNIHGFVGGLFPELTKGNVSFIGNYVHQLTCWNSIDNNNDCVAGAAKGGDHCNGWGDGSGVDTGDTTSTMLVQDNTFLNDNGDCASGALSFFNDSGPNGHLNAHSVVNHNLLATSGWAIFSTDQYRSPYFSYMGITNNNFAGINGKQPFVFRNVPPYFTWPIGATANSYNNYNCGNVWDTDQYNGAGADSDIYFPTQQYPVLPCPKTLPWTPPNGWYQP